MRSARQCYPGRAASSRSRLKPIHLVCRSAGSCQVAAASSGGVRCDSRRSPLAAMPGEQPVIDPNIIFDAICSKSAAKILALVAMVIDGGLGVNSSPLGLADPRFPSCRTRAERASNEALRACACTRQKTDHNQAIEIGQGFPASARLGQTSPLCGFMECSSQGAGHRSGTHPNRRAAMGGGSVKRSRANKVENCFPYCPISDRSHSAIPL